MGFLQKTAAFVLWTGVVALAEYELVAKSRSWLAHPLPGWREAERVEREVRFRAWTGLSPVDRVLHEGAETRAFYVLLLR